MLEISKYHGQNASHFEQETEGKKTIRTKARRNKMDLLLT